MIPDRKCPSCGRQIVRGCISVSLPSSLILYFCDRACLRRHREGRTDG